ncbi:MAG: tetratricopeptide repeat protein, partial [Xenococcus sp. (in: cyanobacteria)]
FTMEEDVLPYEPDICFVEYMVSDRVKTNTPPKKIGASIEGIVRKLRAINCEVIFLYRYLEKKLISNVYTTSLLEHEKVARYYNICSINFGSYIQETLDSQKYQASDLFKDHTHTNKFGAEVIAKFISDSIFLFGQNNASFNRNSKKLSELPTIYDKCFQKTKIVYAHQGLIKDKSNFDVSQIKSRITSPCGNIKQHSYFIIDSRNEFQFDVQHELIGLIVVAGLDSGYIQLESQGEKEKILAWDKWCHYDRFKTIIIDKNYSQLTKLTVTITDEKVDYSECRRTISHPDKIIKKLKLIGLMVNVVDDDIARTSTISNQINQKSPQNLEPNLLLEEGDQLVSQDKISQAIEKFAKAIQIKPNCIPAHFKLAEIYENTKKFDQAQTHYHQIVQLEPENSMVLAKLAKVTMKQGKLKEAIVTYQKILDSKTKEPKWFRAWIYIGMADAMIQNEHIEKAITACRQAIKVKPNYFPAHNKLAYLLMRQKRQVEAIPYYQRSIEIQPNQPALIYGQLGDALYAKMQLDLLKADHAVTSKLKFASWQNIEANYRQSIEIEPKNPIYYDRLGKLLVEKGQLEQAIDFFKQSIDLDPSFVSSYQHLGEVLSRQGKSKQATDYYQKAIRCYWKSVPSQESDAQPDALNQKFITKNDKKLAFCFLTINGLNHNLVWQNFFKGYESLVNIYGHSKFNQDLGLLHNKQIPNKIATSYFQYKMSAERELLKEALKCSQNDKFILISESCIPLQLFDYIYNKLMTDNDKSYVTIQPTSPVYWRKTSRMMKGLKLQECRKNSQWIILNRKHAQMMIDDEILFNQVRETFFLEEQYPSTLLNFNNQVDHILNQRTTFDDFKRGADGRPYLFSTITEFDRMLLLEAKNQGLFFARKFAQSANLEPLYRETELAQLLINH